MSTQDQPNQGSIQLDFADGVLTVTGYWFGNDGVCTSLADESSATTTVTRPGAGQVKWVTVITPNTPLTSADNTVKGNIYNATNQFA